MLIWNYWARVVSEKYAGASEARTERFLRRRSCTDGLMNTGLSGSKKRADAVLGRHLQPRTNAIRTLQCAPYFYGPRSHLHCGHTPSLRGILAEVGWTPEGLTLIDGHARRDLDPETMVPVLVLDVTEEEANKLLAVLDPLAAMAGADTDQLEALLAQVSTESQALEDLLSTLAKQNGLLVDEAFDSQAAGKEFDESAADDLQICECPQCGYKFPK